MLRQGGLSVRRFGPFVLALMSAGSALGETRYVSPSGSHTPPFTTWSTAAINIQSAIDASAAGDTVLVAGGVYDTGETVVHGALPNRVAITNAIIVRSVNGPGSSVIVGQGPLGDSAVRCAYVGEGARLEGFTLTNGYTRTTGDISTEQSGGGALCEPSAVLSNCVVTGNVAEGFGGGTYRGSIRDCVIAGNGANGEGGGSAGGTLWGCTIIGNSAFWGGGTSYSTVRNCFISGNTGGEYGGGADLSTVLNCTIVGNMASLGGGTSDCTVRNCIVYYNSADEAENCYYGLGTVTVDYTCTIPAMRGEGNITDAPGLAGRQNPHLFWDSPCIDAGVNEDWMIEAVDIDGEPRIRGYAVDMGCDEFYGGGGTGELTVALSVAYTNVAVGFPVPFVADVEGWPAGCRWLWGDGTITTNTLHPRHAYDQPGGYQVELQVWNLAQSASTSLTVHVVGCVTNYVSPSGTHTPPYATWETAATNIQAAILAQDVVGGVVLVANGSYDTGSVVVEGDQANRIAITRPVVVRSVNGPDHTTIAGSGSDAPTPVRCAYVGDYARLEGFTLTLGKASQGGGAWCRPTSIVSNCALVRNEAEQGGGIAGGTIIDSTIAYNEAVEGGWGGGAYRCNVLRCSIVRNRSTAIPGWVWETVGGNGGGIYEGSTRHSDIWENTAEGAGGGVWGGSIQSCVIRGNDAGSGGGTSESMARDCIILDNRAYDGGGSSGGNVEDCTLIGNSASRNGGGALIDSLLSGEETSSGVVRNCLITKNHAEGAGGGAFAFDHDEVGVLESCTIIGNTAGESGGGAVFVDVRNCIVYDNIAPQDPNHASCRVAYSCTVPDPEGTGNITSRPEFLGSVDPHLMPNSPCIDAGSNQAWMASAVDLDGEPRVGNATVDIGCDEYYADGGTGVLSVGAAVSPTDVAVGSPILAVAQMRGRPAGYRWRWGDGTITSNALYASHSFTDSGDYDVVLEVWTANIWTSATASVHVIRDTKYVSLSGSHTWPYETWATAATNIQDAIDAFLGRWIPGRTVLVGDGVYDTGAGHVQEDVTSRIAVLEPLTVRSVNGPEHTVIVGDRAGMRCAYLAAGARLEGFTLTGGRASEGGGALCEDGSAVVARCIITGNAADSGAGIRGGLIQNSLLAGNTADHVGGGAHGSTLRNCTVVSNTAGSDGGGVYECGLVNCIVDGNTAPQVASSGVSYSCTTPGVSGVGNIAEDPLFVDAGLSDYRLSGRSRCINAGRNGLWMLDSVDLAGRPRVQEGGVDMGAYESVYTPYVFVSPTGLHRWPYTNWVTAATNLQAGVNEARDGDIVLVADGVYDAGGTVVWKNLGGKLTNRIAVTRAATVASVNGPGHTFIVGRGPMGDGAVRCAYLGNGARLVGFTLMGGHTRTNGDLRTEQSGGGVWCEPTAVVSDCVIIGSVATAGGGIHGGTVQHSTITRNTASWGGGADGGILEGCTVISNTADYGGGVYWSTVRNSLLVSNTADLFGGASYYGTLLNCTVVSNLANWGGGTYEGVVRNGIVYFNTASQGDWNYSGGLIEYSCTTPDPGGIGSMDEDPQFADASVSGLRLLASSPCVDAGRNEAWMVQATDLDQLPRIENGTVDLGAYELVVPGPDDDQDGLDDAWELAHFLGLTNVWYHSDWDRDGFCDGAELRAGTSPVDAASYLGISAVEVNPSVGRVIIRWSSVSNRLYSVYAATNLPDGPGMLLERQVPATPPENVYIDSVDAVDLRIYAVGLDE